MLGRAATLEDVSNVAAFVASDRAATMTGATANIGCAALVHCPASARLTPALHH
jgi:3-oxoacyl-[acyl-carrier protein] reductase